MYLKALRFASRSIRLFIPIQTHTHTTMRCAIVACLWLLLTFAAKESSALKLCGSYLVARVAHICETTDCEKTGTSEQYSTYKGESIIFSGMPGQDAL